MKTLTLVTKGKNNCDALYTQLEELLGDRVHIEGYYLEGNIHPMIGKDLILASSSIALELTEKYLNPLCPRIVALRSVSYRGMEALLDLPPGTQALLVNDASSSALETISFLNAIGMNHIEYFPYVPGMKEQDFPNLNLAITPGESDLVPKSVEKVIDIENRNIDFITLIEILRILSLLDEKANLLSAKYVSSMLDLLKKNKHMADLNKHMENQLKTIINTVRDGIIALDEKNDVAVFNSIAEGLLGYPGEMIIGKNATDQSLRDDIRALLEKADSVHESSRRVNGRQLIVNSSPISKDALTSYAGRVFTLNDVTEIQRLEENHRRELVSQQNYARYTFDHILGQSDIIRMTKTLAQRIASSDSPTLIHGESGTGKELLAQGIHNASPRKYGPFIAVNFASLSESLLESELFGYEEGAFTGAKKGGMAGLFQQAHKGTIFLDEIGDAPLSFQVKLLRVLQEKQVRRIGSSRVIPIDIRVIVATNKNLKNLIDQGLFRQDLYYRLNVLPIKLPPLVERKQDIEALARHFYLSYFNGHPLHPEEDYFHNLKEYFFAYDWPGNIRELQNVIEYLVNISPNTPPVPEMLPEELRVMTKLSHKMRELCKEGENSAKLLGFIAAANALNEPVGRRSLALKMGLSEGIVRGLLRDLEVKGYLMVRRGRKGLSLTSAGSQVVRVQYTEAQS